MAGATALRRAIIIIICNILCSISVPCDSMEQVRLHMHLAHSSCVSVEEGSESVGG